MYKKNIIIVFCFLVLLIMAAVVSYRAFSLQNTSTQAAAVAAIVTSPFSYNFSSPGILKETGEMNQSTSPYWWVNSGGAFVLASSTGQTIHGDLSLQDYWHKLYANSNPLDTDLGFHPQNIFRLVSRNTWHNFRQEVYYKIDADRLSTSPNRNSSNGLLLFNRYRDGQNLYYTGVRVDGTAVIKKKTDGVYYTMAYNKIFPGIYNPLTSPNLLPHNTWIGVRSEVMTNATGTVTVNLYTDVGETGKWTLVATAQDTGKNFGGRIIDDKAYVGMRTDFMDVSFKKYRIQEL